MASPLCRKAGIAWRDEPLALRLQKAITPRSNSAVRILSETPIGKEDPARILSICWLNEGAGLAGVVDRDFGEPNRFADFLVCLGNLKGEFVAFGNAAHVK